MTKVTGWFETRRAADLAIEHLVQQAGVRREAIQASAEGEKNTVGVRTAGSDRADAQPGSHNRNDAPLEGAVKISIAVENADVAEVRRVLGEARVRDISEG